jgi:hypothetical protein
MKRIAFAVSTLALFLFTFVAVPAYSKGQAPVHKCAMETCACCVDGCTCCQGGECTCQDADCTCCKDKKCDMKQCEKACEQDCDKTKKDKK